MTRSKPIIKRPLPKRVRTTRMTQEQKNLLEQRRWVEFLESLDANSYYHVPLPTWYEKALINTTAKSINNSKRKPKEFDVYDPPADFSVYVHVRKSPIEKIRASRKPKPNIFSQRSEYLRKHQWRKILSTLGPGEHRIQCHSVREAVAFQKKIWDSNNAKKYPCHFSTRIRYNRKVIIITAIPWADSTVEEDV